MPTDDGEEVQVRIQTFEMRGEVLVRAVSVGQTRVDRADEMTLQDVEFYNDGFIIRYDLMLSDVMDAPHVAFQVDDNLGGSKYQQGKSYFRGDGWHWEGDARLVPAIDSAASNLLLVAKVLWPMGEGVPPSHIPTFEFVVPLA